MVDLTIAANFVRELTEEQFAEQQRPRRRPPAGGRPSAAKPAPPRSGRGERATARRSDARAPRGARFAATRLGAGFAATRLGRTLSRLGQVRG